MNADVHSHVTRQGHDIHLSVVHKSFGQRCLKFRSGKLWNGLQYLVPTCLGFHRFKQIIKHKMLLYLHLKNEQIAQLTCIEDYIDRHCRFLFSAVPTPWRFSPVIFHDSNRKIASANLLLGMGDTFWHMWHHLDDVTWHMPLSCCRDCIGFQLTTVFDKKSRASPTRFSTSSSQHTYNLYSLGTFHHVLCDQASRYNWSFQEPTPESEPEPSVWQHQPSGTVFL